MKRNIFEVRVRLSAPVEEPEIDEAGLEMIVRQALWGAEDGDDVRTLSIDASVIDTDVELP